MGIQSQGQVGPQTLGDGVAGNLRQGKTGEQVMQLLHGRYFEQVSRGKVFSIGCSVTALSANTIALTSSSTPILGLYNPTTSGVNAVILQAALAAFANTLSTPIGPGVFVWACSVGNTAVSTGSNPVNRLTLASSGSAVKGFPGGVALTGLTNNVVIFEVADFPAFGGLTSDGTISASTATSNATAGLFGVQNFEGSLIIPPGGVLSLVNTTSTTTYSVAGRLLWEEVPV